MLEKILGNKTDKSDVQLDKSEVIRNNALYQSIKEIRNDKGRFISARRINDTSYLHGLISSQSYAIQYTPNEDRTNIKEKEIIINNFFGIPYKKK